MFDWKKAIDRVFQEEIDRKYIAGGQYLLLHKGKEVYYNTYGYADLEKGTVMKKDTIIRLFSMSKPITAAATMMLVERGMLDLRDPISKYIEAFHNQKVLTPEGKEVPAWRDITVWDCLNMRTGIPYPENWDGCSEVGRKMDVLFKELIGRQESGEPISTREYVDRIAEIPLAFQPGERWMYGLSADILGAVIEVVTGQRYGEFLRENLFTPLEMNDTGFYVPKDKEWRFAANYTTDWANGGLLPYTESHLGEHYKEDVAFESGGAGLVSTLQDYSHFATMLLQKGEYKGKRILSAKTVEFMSKDRMSDEQRAPLNWDSNLGCGYGCLMRVLVDEGAAQTLGSVGEYGWDGWTGNYFTISPQDDMVMFFIVQKCDHGFTTELSKIRNITYAAIRDLEA